MPARIDLTVVSDTGDVLLTPRNLLVAVDLIGAVVDVSNAGHPSGGQTKLSLRELVPDRSPNGCGVGITRNIVVIESYRHVCMLINHAEAHERL
ncbi:hypothetical protein [Acidovorax sp.]|uniref:hypothetical protein n=1 Tax=Acidovorax sp. TaxID=1872122 RepID=UPI00391F7915